MSRNYSGDFTPTIAFADAVTRIKVRLIELVNINLVTGTAVYVDANGMRWQAKRTALGWFAVTQ